MRNAFCFQGEVWCNVRKVVFKACGAMRRWRSLCSVVEVAQLERIRGAGEQGKVTAAHLHLHEPARFGGCSPELQLGGPGSGRFITF